MRLFAALFAAFLVLTYYFLFTVFFPLQLEQMEMELRSVPQSTRVKLQPKVKNFKSDLARLRRDLKSSTNGSARDELLSGGSDLDQTSQDQRQRLLQANSRLENSSARLQESTRIVIETRSLSRGFVCCPSSVFLLLFFLRGRRGRHSRQPGPSARDAHLVAQEARQRRPEH